ncbi:uncharacterized histidine-rich protein DDB_G0274557 [Sitophilus oryzae]|uniref:Uncharacterized histidine-rich protein DDB_G0274557 n=1 Tax=Sitophilus oryzae TaxID=7048 RepID=A0A6J2YR90_SITOR|nr:uncharacterized histidine-rich protein DDB_G0274557 [Sitophilus oryzae]
MSGPRMTNMGQMNGNRRPNISRMNIHDNRSHHDHRQQSSHYDNRQPSSHHDNRHQHTTPQPINSQHEDLIKYIYDSWSKVEMDRGSSNVMYYQEHENHHLKDFRPFDLEAYWGRRMHQNHQQHPNHHPHQSHHQHQTSHHHHS